MSEWIARGRVILVEQMRSYRSTRAATQLCHGVQSSLRELLAPTFDRPVLVDLFVDPFELLQATLVELPMLEGEVPSFILVINLGHSSHAGLFLLTAQGKVPKLRASKLFDKPLECLSHLPLIVTPPVDRMPNTTNEVGNFVATDLLILDVDVLQHAEVAIHLGQDDVLRDVVKAWSLSRPHGLRKFIKGLSMSS